MLKLDRPASSRFPESVTGILYTGRYRNIVLYLVAISEKLRESHVELFACVVFIKRRNPQTDDRSAAVIGTIS
jgi:hypothetical protein